MVVQKFHSECLLTFFLIGSISSACAAENLTKQVKLINRIEACHKVEVKKVFIHRNLLLADAVITSIKSAGYCGCKSALLSYSVSTGNSGKTKHVEYGKFVSFNSGNYSFVLDRDVKKITNIKNYNLSIQCASPD